MPEHGPTSPPEPPEPAAHAPSPLEVRDALSRVLTSHQLARSDRLKRLLAYVVEGTLAGRADELKESVLALEVFDRGASFDPRTDSIVRIEARRLRDRLTVYYEGAGADDPVLITLPKGHYSAEFGWRLQARASATAGGPRAAVDVAPAPAVTDGTLPDHPDAHPDAPVTLPARRSRVGPVLLAVSLALTLAILAGLFVVRGRPTNGPLPVIAVLPFENVSADVETERFAFGLVEEVTTAIAGLPGVRVIARSSAFQFPGKSQDIGVVGQRLGATHVVEGSIRRQGGRLRVSAQLIRTADSQHVWAGTFEEDAKDGFRVEDAVAEGVAGSLARALPGGFSPAARRRTVNPAVYQLLLEGRATRAERSLESTERALPIFERAVAADPNSAPALTAMAEALATLAFHGLRPQHQAASSARDALAKAIALDDTLAEAHGTLAWILFFEDWNWTSADREFRRALSINPSVADTHNRYALMLMAQQRREEALTHARAARELDPLSFSRANDLGVVLLGTGHLAEALEHARRALRFTPDSRAARGLAGVTLAAQARYSEAAAELEAALKTGVRYTYLLGSLGYARARLDDVEGARRLADETRQACEAGTGSWVHLAYVQAALGDTEGAVRSVTRAVDERDVEVLFMDAQPLLSPLRGLPGFQALRGRVGLGR